MLEHTAAVAWEGVLAYRADIEADGGRAVLAYQGQPVGELVDELETPLGGELVLIARADGRGADLEALRGDATRAPAGACILWDSGEPGVPVELWQVLGRYRRVATVRDPSAVEQRVHVLLRLEGAVQ